MVQGNWQMSPAELERVAKVLVHRHRRLLRPAEHVRVLHMRAQDTETVTVDVVDGPEVFRFEAQVHLEDLGGDGGADLLMDFMDAVLREWLEGQREAYPTLDFSPYEFEGVVVGLRGGALRPDLEDQADRLLGLDPKSNSDIQ